MTRSRPKGVDGERDAAALWRDAGATLRGLEAGGDHLLTLGGVLFAQEVKRCERLKIPEWQRQQARDAVPGAIPLLTYRQNRQPWYTVIRTEDLIRLLAVQADNDSRA